MLVNDEIPDFKRIDPDLRVVVEKVIRELDVAYDATKEDGYDGVIEPVMETHAPSMRRPRSRGTWGDQEVYDPYRLPDALRQLPVNVIPSDKIGPCEPILVAFMRGDTRGEVAPMPIFRQVRSHLVNCYQVTRVVILVMDVWNPSKHFAESRLDLDAHRSRGIAFIPLIAHPDGLARVSLP